MPPRLPLWARLLEFLVPCWRATDGALARCRRLAHGLQACRGQRRPLHWSRASAMAVPAAAPGPGPVNAWLQRQARRLEERAERERRRANERYVAFRSATPDPWLRDLHPGQLRAALAGEDANRVLASAGTGKTKTMVAKAIDLIHRDGIAACEIAFVTFTRNAAAEIRERIAKSAGAVAGDMRIGTIHALARDLLRAERHQAVRLHDLVDDGRRIEWLSHELTRTISGNDAFAEAVDERRLSIREFEVERARADVPFYRAAGQGDGVLLRSKAESAAALAFWAHRIPYVYESEYPLSEEKRDPERADYRPDFHLPQQDCYVEIWAGDSPDRLPEEWSEQEREQYWRDRQWKRELHRRQGTRLAEASATERLLCLRDGESFAALLLGRVAEAVGTTFGEFAAARRPADEIRAEKDRLWQPYRISSLAGEVDAWMSVIRSRRLSAEDIHRKLDRAGGHGGAVALSAIAEPVMRAYLDELAATGRPDHDETVEWAIRAVEAGRVPIPWRALIVDEHQDTNPAQNRLIHAICERRGPDGLRPRLWAVGDDWQAIYGFQGSDVGIIRRLGQHGACDATALCQTWRFGPALAEASRAFVLRDENAIDKPLRGRDDAWSDPHHPQPIQLLSSALTDRGKQAVRKLGWNGADGPTGAILCVLQRIAGHGFRGRPGVLILGRTRDATEDRNRPLKERADELHERWRRQPHRAVSDGEEPASLARAALAEAKKRREMGIGIDYGAIRQAAARLGIAVDLDKRTIHGAKGMEADYVILVDVGESAMSGRAEVMARERALAPFTSPDAGGRREERRLWYVAMTRAKRKCYIVTPCQDTPRSAFVDELAQGMAATGELAGLTQTVAGRRVACPACRNRKVRLRDAQLVIRQGRHGAFAGCSSYGYEAHRCGHRERLCPECNSALVARTKRGEGKCTAPQCGRRMPLCDCDPPKPMVRRNGRDASRFFGCQDYGRAQGCSKTVNIE